MAQTSYSTITITDTTDITDVYLQYALALSTANENDIKNNNYSFNHTGEIGWSTIYPTWVSGYQIWVRQVRIKEGINNPEYGTPYLDKAINQVSTTINATQANLTALSTKLKKIWINETTNGTYLAGTYAASGLNHDPDDFNTSDPSTYGYNTLLRHNALYLRYNTINMTTLSTNALTFYTPTQENNQWIQGIKGLELTAEGMEVFQTDGGNPAQAISVAKFSNEVRVGTEDNSSITITDASIKGVGVSGKEFFEFTNSTTNLTTTNTNKIFKKLLDFPSTEATGLGLLLRETPTSAPALRVIIVQSGQTTAVDTGMVFTVGTSSHNTLSLSSYGTLYIDYDGNTNFSKIYITPHYSADYITTIELRISYSVTSLAPAFQLGSKHSTTGGYSYAEGYDNRATGNYSHAEGYHTTASGARSHAEGYYTTASNDYSHAEGYYTIASGANAHAEGGNTTAEDADAHAEGYNTLAHAYCSHAEGWNTVASGDHSHAEGRSTRASGHYSHAQNNNTIAASYNQTAIGKYNQEESGNNYALIIGNGTADNARSNALTVDWDGNVDVSGEITDGNGKTVSKAWFYTNGITSTAIGTQSTNVKIPITAIASASSGFAYDSTEKGIKCEKSGTYAISIQIGCNPATSGDLMGISIFKNGTATVGPEYERVGGTYDTVKLLPTPIQLEENDVLTIYARNNSGARGTVTSCRLMCWEVG